MADYATERAILDDHRAEWCTKHPGAYVVIDGTRVVGFRPNLDEALTFAHATLGTVEAFICEVTPEPLRVVVPRWGWW